MENYLQEISGGSFFDPIKGALGDVIDLYAKVQQVKLTNQLTQAQMSAASYGLPSRQQDAQAIAQSQSVSPSVNKWLVGGAILVGAAALFVIVRK